MGRKITRNDEMENGHVQKLAPFSEEILTVLRIEI
jgi:hypothetical protein